MNHASETALHIALVGQSILAFCAISMVPDKDCVTRWIIFKVLKILQSFLCERWWFIKYLFLLVSVWKYFLILNIFTNPLRRDCKVVQKASYNSKIIPRPPMILRIIPKSTYWLSKFFSLIFPAYVGRWEPGKICPMTGSNLWVKRQIGESRAWIENENR